MCGWLLSWFTTPQVLVVSGNLSELRDQVAIDFEGGTLLISNQTFSLYSTNEYSIIEVSGEIEEEPATGCFNSRVNALSFSPCD